MQDNERSTSNTWLYLLCAPGRFQLSMLTWVVRFTGRTMVLIIHISLSCCAYKSTNRAPLQAIQWSTAITSHSPRSRNTVTGNAGAWLRTAQACQQTCKKQLTLTQRSCTWGPEQLRRVYLFTHHAGSSRQHDIRSSQLTCKSGKIWCGGVAGKAFWKSGDTVTLKTTVLRGARQLLIHDCGAV